MRVEEELILIMHVINQFRESCNPVCFTKHKDCVARIQGEAYMNIRILYQSNTTTNFINLFYYLGQHAYVFMCFVF